MKYVPKWPHNILYKVVNYTGHISSTAAGTYQIRSQKMDGRVEEEVILKQVLLAYMGGWGWVTSPGV